MRLAWRNIIHDRTRFSVAALGIAFAVFLMVFQSSLLLGFIRAAGNVINSIDADIWITARGVTCFEFAAFVPERYRYIAEGVPGVIRTGRMSMAFAEYRMPSGAHQTVALIGTDVGVAGRFPLPHSPSSNVINPDAVVIDSSDAVLLEARSPPVDTEINGRRARVVAIVSGFSSFLGCPYVFTSYTDAALYSRLPIERSMYILVKVAGNYRPEDVKLDLQKRLPDVDVRTKKQFANL